MPISVSAVTTSVERLADGAGLLGAVEHRDGLHRLGQRREEVLDGERPEQSGPSAGRLFAARGEASTVSWRFRAEPIMTMTRSASGAPNVVEQLILRPVTDWRTCPSCSARWSGKPGRRDCRLARLEVDVGILRRAAHHGMVGRERALAMRAHQVVVDHGAHVVGVSCSTWRPRARCGSRRRSAGRECAIPAWRPARSAPCP
jgi:hypothetical protein